MYSLGIDLGSSSIKASILDLDNGQIMASDNYPKEEMQMLAEQPGWAEQHPEIWWKNLMILLKSIFNSTKIDSKKIKYIGIALSNAWLSSLRY